MNLFENEMRKMFGETDIVTDKKFTGKTMLGKLDDDKLLKLQFISTNSYEHYDAILVSIIGKNEGVLDKETIRFSVAADSKKLNRTCVYITVKQNGIPH